MVFVPQLSCCAGGKIDIGKAKTQAVRFGQRANYPCLAVSNQHFPTGLPHVFNVSDEHTLLGNRHRTNFGIGAILIMGFVDPQRRTKNNEVVGSDKVSIFIPVVHSAEIQTGNVSGSISMVDDSETLDEGRFVCIRRSSDISQTSTFVPAPEVGEHGSEEFGTHHARDAYELFQTIDRTPPLFSSAMKTNSQYMHVIWFNLELNETLTLNDVIDRLDANPVHSEWNFGS